MIKAASHNKIELIMSAPPNYFNIAKDNIEEKIKDTSSRSFK